MSAHGHAHGHGHGHGDHAHGDHAAEERERIIKIYGWSVVIWVCLLAGAFWIYKVGAARHARPPAQRKATLHRAHRAAPSGVAQARKRRPQTERSAIKLSPPERRRTEARRWAQRMRRNGHAVRAHAAGQAHEVFDVRYPADVDVKRRDAQGRHMKELQRSKSFQQHLRGLGFKRVALHVGRRVIWSSNL